MTPGPKGRGARGEKPTPIPAPPAAVLEIARKLEKAGHEAWCVGGAVRDAMLGQAHLDWDFATSATPSQVRSLFRRTIPVGIEFGTIGVLDAHNVMHEVTTFRRDIKTDGRHAVVEFGVSFDDDLARRDFTINAIAYSPTRQVIYDPFDGESDLRSGVVRAVGEPDERMREDRLRALRAMRFAGRYDFRIDERTWDAILSSAPHLTRLSPERVRQEIEKTMNQVKLPSKAFALWRTGGAFAVLVPGLAEVTQVQLRALDHLRLPILSRRPQRSSLRIAMLMAAAPRATSLATLKALRFSNAASSWIASIVEALHELEPQIRGALMSAESASDGQLRRWISTAGRTRFASVMRLLDAKWWAEREAGIGGPSQRSVNSAYRRGIRIAYRDPVELSDLAVDGTDLQKLGLRGPALGRALQELLDAVVADPSMNTPERLTEIAARGARAGDGAKGQSTRGT